MTVKSSLLPAGFDHLLDDFHFRLEERDRWADHLIRFLLTANGGGIAIVMAYAGVLTNAGKPMLGLGWGLAIFSAGLLFVGVQLILSARTVRTGRRAIRKLMVDVLDGQMDYATAFKKMGELPSKWRTFSWLTSLSFACVFGGLVLSFLSISPDASLQPLPAGPPGNHI